MYHDFSARRYSTVHTYLWICQIRYIGPSRCTYVVHTGFLPLYSKISLLLGHYQYKSSNRTKIPWIASKQDLGTINIQWNGSIHLTKEWPAKNFEIKNRKKLTLWKIRNNKIYCVKSKKLKYSTLGPLVPNTPQRRTPRGVRTLSFLTLFRRQPWKRTKPNLCRHRHSMNNVQIT